MAWQTPLPPQTPGEGVEVRNGSDVNYPPPGRLREAPPKRRLPPFAAQQAGKIPSNGVWVFAGKGCWDRVRSELEFNAASRFSVTFPGDEPATAYRWDFAKGQPALIVHLGGLSREVLVTLAACLAVAGAHPVVTIGAEAELGRAISTMGTAP